jgi:hypothetical protein
MDVPAPPNWHRQFYNLSGEIGMTSFVKSALLGLGLVVGASLAAQAQSVSSLPPSSTTAPAQTAVTQPYGSTQSYYPKPGGSETLKQQPDQAAARVTDPGYAPYSSGPGPKPN